LRFKFVSGGVMKTFIFFITLIFSDLVYGQVFEPPVIIDPPNPQAGEMVRVGWFVESFPPCLLLPRENSIGETHSLVFDDNDITLDVLTSNLIICNPLPVSPAPREYYNLGILPAGEYTLNANYIGVGETPPDLIPPFPLPDFYVPQAYGLPVNFVVQGAPQTVNTLSWQGLLFLSTLFLLSFFILRKN